MRQKEAICLSDALRIPLQSPLRELSEVASRGDHDLLRLLGNNSGSQNQHGVAVAIEAVFLLYCDSVGFHR
jgi:hypothetical protein